MGFVWRAGGNGWISAQSIGTWVYLRMSAHTYVCLRKCCHTWVLCLHLCLVCMLLCLTEAKWRVMLITSYCQTGHVGLRLTTSTHADEKKKEILTQTLHGYVSVWLQIPNSKSHRSDAFHPTLYSGMYYFHLNATLSNNYISSATSKQGPALQ